MTFEIQYIASDRHIHVAKINRLLGTQRVIQRLTSYNCSKIEMAFLSMSMTITYCIHKFITILFEIF
jgi:predicted phosphatase